jgi:rhodanese-related sulfurtransferase
VALLLRRKGITRVRPLLGGFHAWFEAGYPMEQDSTLVQLGIATAKR